MSEKIPNHEHITIASLARDITLHFGERVKASEEGDSLVRTEWEGKDANDNLWNVALSSQSIYSSAWYSVSLRSITSSDFHRYTYDVTKDIFTYEFPVGNEIAQDQETTARLMRSWLTHYNTPEAVIYDAEGHEWNRQQELEKMGARLAIHEALDTDEGRIIFGQLLHTYDTQKANELYGNFYNLSRRPEASFYVGRLATRNELESMLVNFRPQQLPPGAVSQNHDE